MYSVWPLEFNKYSFARDENAGTYLALAFINSESVDLQRIF